MKGAWLMLGIVCCMSASCCSIVAGLPWVYPKAAKEGSMLEPLQEMSSMVIGIIGMLIILTGGPSAAQAVTIGVQVMNIMCSAMLGFIGISKAIV